MTSRRQEILLVARGLFAGRGYPGTSMRDIADAVGVLPGSLYTHFKSKAQMIQEILVAFYSELLPAQQSVLRLPGTGAARLAAMIEVAYSVGARFPEELTILHYDQNEISTLEELDEVRRLGLETLDTWIEVIEEGMADGSLKAGLPPELVMRMVTSSIHGVLDTVRYRHRGNARREGDSAATITEVLLSGLQA